MSTLILKGNILNFVARIEDENMLREILDFCFAKAKEMHLPDGMPPEVVAELKDALQRSYDENNLIPHEIIKEQRQQWLAELRG